MPIKTTTKKPATKKQVVGKKPKAVVKPKIVEKKQPDLELEKVDPVKSSKTSAKQFDGVEVSEPATSNQQPATKFPGKEKYFESVGRRKTAVARVRLLTKKSSDQEPPEGRALIIVGGKPYYEYFKDQELANIVDSPFKKLKSLTRFKATVIVNGGGTNGQAEAVRHGISRALTMFDENFAKKLKKAQFLTRDSRRKERKKPGLKKARKGPRWAKR